MQLYTPGKWAAGTPQDELAMAEAAFTGWVFFMRRHGQRLRAQHVGDPSPGQVLLINRYDEQDRFYVRLYHPGQWTDWSVELHSARLERSNDGVHLLRGEEWISALKEHRLQTWLCVPTPERGQEILRKMAARERLS